MSICTTVSTKHKFILFFCVGQNGFAKVHCIGGSSFVSLWFERWLVGLWQCVQCGSAIVLKNVRWQKNKKHWVGLSVGSLVSSIFRFSVLSQWFTFQFMSFVVCLLHLAVTFSGLAKVAIFTTNVDAENQTLINHKCVCGALNRHFCQTRVIGGFSLSVHHYCFNFLITSS